MPTAPTPMPTPATATVRHNERLQVMVAHVNGVPVFNHLKAYGQVHTVDASGAIVQRGEDLVTICDVSDPDLRPDVRAALTVLVTWADGLKAGTDTPEQVARQAAERAAAEAKREADAKAAAAKATADA